MNRKCDVTNIKGSVITTDSKCMLQSLMPLP